MLSNLLELDVPLEGARRALFYTSNSSTMAALDWLSEEERDMVTPVEEEIEMLREAFLENPARGNVVFVGGGMYHEVDSDSMEEEMEFVLMLVVNTSLNLTPGKMSLAGAKATARLIPQVKESLGMDSLMMWDQCGRTTEVRGARDSEEMEMICQQVETEWKGMMIMVEFDKNRTREGEERQVLAVFGEMDDLHEVLGELPLVK